MRNFIHSEGAHTQPKGFATNALEYGSLECIDITSNTCLHHTYQCHPEAWVVFRHAKHEHYVQEDCGYEDDQTG